MELRDWKPVTVTRYHYWKLGQLCHVAVGQWTCNMLPVCSCAARVLLLCAVPCAVKLWEREPVTEIPYHYWNQGTVTTDVLSVQPEYCPRGLCCDFVRWRTCNGYRNTTSVYGVSVCLCSLQTQQCCPIVHGRCHNSEDWGSLHHSLQNKRLSCKHAFCNYNFTFVAAVTWSSWVFPQKYELCSDKRTVSALTKVPTTKT